MIWAMVMGPAEGMAATAGAYWAHALDGHGFCTSDSPAPSNGDH